jgi:hypothetical protein
MQTPELNFEKLGLILPPAPKPLGVYKPCLISQDTELSSRMGL